MFAGHTTGVFLGHLFLLWRGKKTESFVEMEPEWTKNISNEVVCNFFYFFYVLYAVLAVFAVFSLISLYFISLPKNIMIATGIQGVLMALLATTGALFHYLVCSRALLPSIGGMKREY